MSKIINRALLFEQVKRFWAIPAFAVLVNILLVYMPMRNHDGWWTIRRLTDVVTMGFDFHTISMVITPLVAAFCTFGMFFNKKTATAFYSMPLNKNQLFATNALAGIILSLIPIFVLCLLLLIPVNMDELNNAFRMHGVDSFGGWQPQQQVPLAALPGGLSAGAPINSFPVVFSLFMQMSLASIFYFAVAWLAFSLAGHGFVALCLVAVLPLMPTAVLVLAEGIGSLFLFGFHRLFDEQTLMRFLAYHNPALWGIAFIRPDTMSRMYAVYIPALLYTVQAAALFGLAWFASRRRSPERTGNSVIFNPVKNVLVFIFAFVGLFIMAAIFYTTNESIVNMYLGAIIGFAVGYVIAQMIAEKSFLVMDKIKYFPIFGGVAVALYLVMIVVTQFGMGFYVNRVPARDDVYAVFVTTGWSMPSGITDEEWRMISISDTNVIEETRAAHQTILDNRREIWQIPALARNRSMHRMDEDGRIFMRENIFFKYILNNGNIMWRQYAIDTDFLQDVGLVDFRHSELVELSQFVALRLPQYVEQVIFNFTTHERNPNTERFDTLNQQRIVITDRDEINLALELIAQVTLEHAELQSYAWARWDGDSASWTSLHMSVQSSAALMRDGRWSRLPFWNMPHLTGDAIYRMLELLGQHGLGESEFSLIQDMR